jgi:hypothetical protein
MVFTSEFVVLRANQTLARDKSSVIAGPGQTSLGGNDWMVDVAA